MMEAQIKLRGGSLVVKIEGETQKDIFRQLSQVQEIFDSENACAICGNVNIRFRVRTVDGNEFYELACPCGGTFQFGQHRQGSSLFPRRKSADGAPLPNGGWARWEGGA